MVNFAKGYERQELCSFVKNKITILIEKLDYLNAQLELQIDVMELVCLFMHWMIWSISWYWIQSNYCISRHNAFAQWCVMFCYRIRDLFYPLKLNSRKRRSSSQDIHSSDWILSRISERDHHIVSSIENMLGKDLSLFFSDFLFFVYHSPLIRFIFKIFEFVLTYLLLKILISKSVLTAIGKTSTHTYSFILYFSCLELAFMYVFFFFKFLNLECLCFDRCYM